MRGFAGRGRDGPLASRDHQPAQYEREVGNICGQLGDQVAPANGGRAAWLPVQTRRPHQNIDRQLATRGV